MLKLQHFGHLIRTVDSLEKSLTLGKFEGRRRRGCQNEMTGWHHRCNGHELGQTSGDGEGQGSLVCCSPWDCRVWYDWATEQQQEYSAWLIISLATGNWIQSLAPLLKEVVWGIDNLSFNYILYLNIQKTVIMLSGPITSWQIDGETMETVTDFIFSGSKITAGGDCSHEIKRHLLLGRKTMTNLDSRRT